MGSETPARPRLILHVVLSAVLLGLLVAASVKYAPMITALVSRTDSFRAYVASHGAKSILIYILVQAAQIVIAVIPGEVVQIAGGYAFGTGPGLFFALLGTILGTLIVFFTVRLVGATLVKAVVPARTYEKLSFLINTPKAEIAVFLLFLIPGIPKDALVYISGLTPVRPLRFLLVCTIARLPGLWGSAYIGAHLQERDYLTVWIVSGVSLVLFVIGVLLRKRLIETMARLRRRGKAGGQAA